MAELAVMCQARYGEHPVVIANYNRAKKGASEVATSKIEDGKPYAILFLPSLIDHLAVYRTSNIPHWQDYEEDALAAIILHEFEHLAYGYMAQERTFGATVDAESRTWAITCEKVIGPLGQHDVWLTSNMTDAYEKWVACGRNVNSPQWTNWIAQNLADPK